MPVYITWLGVAFALHGSAQTTPAARIPPVLARAIQRIDPPARPGGWVLQVITRGGLDGRGTGDLTVDSNGDATSCTPPTAAPWARSILASSSSISQFAGFCLRNGQPA